MSALQAIGDEKTAMGLERFGQFFGKGAAWSVAGSRRFLRDAFLTAARGTLIDRCG